MNKMCGSFYYNAPEVVGKKYDQKCDIWSCGVIMYILLCGLPPFQGESDQEVITKVKRDEPKFTGSIWNSVSKEAKDLIKQMLQKDPKCRPTAAKVLSHPWFHFKINKIEVDQSIQFEALRNLKQFKKNLKL